MALSQDQVLGQNYVTVVEKLTGEDHSLLIHLNMDVPASKLVQQVVMEFQAGEGWSRIPTGSDVNPTGHTLAVGPIAAAPRTWKFTASGGSPDLDMGLSLYENNVKDGDTIEVIAR